MGETRAMQTCLDESCLCPFRCPFFFSCSSDGNLSDESVGDWLANAWRIVGRQFNYQNDNHRSSLLARVSSGRGKSCKIRINSKNIFFIFFSLFRFFCWPNIHASTLPFTLLFHASIKLQYFSPWVATKILERGDQKSCEIKNPVRPKISSPDRCVLLLISSSCSYHPAFLILLFSSCSRKDCCFLSESATNFAKKVPAANRPKNK